MSVTLQLGGGCQPTPNGRINTGTDTILSYQALFGLLNATKQGKTLPSEFRAGKEAWNAVYDLFSERSEAVAGTSTRSKPDPDSYELGFAGVPVVYDATMPSDAIQSWRIGVMYDTKLGELVGVER